MGYLMDDERLELIKEKYFQALRDHNKLIREALERLQRQQGQEGAGT